MNAYVKIFISFSILIFGSIGCVQGKSNSSIPFLAYLDFGDSKTTSTFSVSQISPGPNVTGVSLNTSIQLGFSQKLDSSSIQSQSIQLTQGNAVIPGNITSDEKTILFNPTSPLAASKVYSVRVSKDIKSAEGSSLAEETVWNFTTATIVDAVAPALSLRTPAVGATLVPNNTSVQVSFTETMDCTSIDNTILILKNNVTNIQEPANVACLGSVATLTPTNPLNLAFNTVYRVDLLATAKDLAGNPLTAAYNWTFTTGPAPDLVQPTVSFVSPAPNAQNVPTNGAVSIAFSEPINCATIPGSIVLDDNPLLPGTIAGNLGCTGTTATFTPLAVLAPNTVYTLTIAGAITDLFNNPLTAVPPWTFTTGPAPDLTQPTVTFTVPAANAIGVGVNVNPTIVFSEPMACASVNNASFRVRLQATPGVYLAGSVNCFGTSATWIPDPVLNPTLAFNTLYTAEVNAGATDSVNNPIVPITWNFTTGPGPDLTPPSVAFVTPANGALGVAVNGGVSIAFDETMNCGSVLGGITLDDDPLTPATLVPININCNGNTVSLAPAAPPLAFNTPYTVKIANTVTDSNNNPLNGGDYIWSFTTGIAPDITPPQIALVSPLAAATGVPTNANITVSFNETIDCASLNLTVNNGIGVTKNCSGASATFVPNVGTPLNAGTTYTVNLVAVNDLQGIPMAAVPPWTFTTGLAADVTPPTVTIQNVRNNSIIESGFIIGTAADDRSVGSVEVSVDGGGFTNANVTGTTSWKYQLPTGAATWKPGSQHTIIVKAIDTSNNVTTTGGAITVRKGTNKDINGDGYVDLVTSEYGQGLVYIFYSSGTAGITATDATMANRTIAGVKTDFFGKTIASGDFNGDGFADIAVGAPKSGGIGKVYIFHSNQTLGGINTSFYMFANTILTGSTVGEDFGGSLSTGDLSGDRYTDLVVGAPAFSTSKGRIYVFHSQGGAGIATATVTTTGVCTAGCNYFRGGITNNDKFGFSIAVGNINGDMYDDITVGVPGHNGGTLLAGNGRVYVYYSSNGTDLTVPNTLDNTANNYASGGYAQFGYSIAVANFNGDNYDDVVVGAPEYNPSAVANNQKGMIFIFTSSGATGIGNIAGMTNAPRYITGDNNQDQIGRAITTGDLNLDGRADLITSTRALVANDIAVFLTPSGSISGTPLLSNKSYEITGKGGNVHIVTGPGKPLSTGDVNGDGIPDLMIGSPLIGNQINIFHLPTTGTGQPANLTTPTSIILGTSLTNGIGGSTLSSNEFGAAFY
ncbi:Ig-like protein [Leptospira weilii serovar Ranarum str. ICFT]|uniref:Ig-like protein n=1 Tax=Leptospira weilii serovar Ranarum str. ICFT TaxID=1218598 RepID=N1WKS8_9LEPT|nr:Ig-like domain-containing protein [Leptospira weilii]EMY76433.1 Ig-like protein [Leptospira weilii serovar Ranarum str. ICFT]